MKYRITETGEIREEGQYSGCRTVTPFSLIFQSLVITLIAVPICYFLFFNNSQGKTVLRVVCEPFGTVAGTGILIVILFVTIFSVLKEKR